MRLPSHPAALALLAIPSWLYGVATDMRNRHYDRPGNTNDAGLPVLSVGNLTVGGTGKTPVVAWLAKRLIAEGLKPAVVSRGYGGRAGKGPLLVSEGHGPMCGSAECGDEPFLLASRIPGALVLVGSDRLAGSRAAAEHGADVVILDDGFQHRRLARDLDILLLDSDDPFGNGRLLPAGGLREPVSAIRRADVIVLTRARGDELSPELEQTVRRFSPTAPMVRSRNRPAGFVDRHGDPAAVPARAVLFCGIGSPGQFRRDIEALGIEIVAFRDYPDHHCYTARDFAELQRLARGGASLVTTEKDLARLQARQELPLTALRIDMEIGDAHVLLEAARAAIRNWSTIRMHSTEGEATK
jgi:tetraacyldisaccharide 4'-kinase